MTEFEAKALYLQQQIVRLTQVQVEMQKTIDRLATTIESLMAACEDEDEDENT